MTAETVAYLSNKAIAQCDVVGKHQLEETVDVRAADGTGAPEAQSDNI